MILPEVMQTFITVLILGAQLENKGTIWKEEGQTGDGNFSP
jgi:hypothetical protein